MCGEWTRSKRRVGGYLIPERPYDILIFKQREGIVNIVTVLVLVMDNEILADRTNLFEHRKELWYWQRRNVIRRRRMTEVSNNVVEVADADDASAAMAKTFLDHELEDFLSNSMIRYRSQDRGIIIRKRTC